MHLLFKLIFRIVVLWIPHAWLFHLESSRSFDGCGSNFQDGDFNLGQTAFPFNGGKCVSYRLEKCICFLLAVLKDLKSGIKRTNAYALCS